MAVINTNVNAIIARNAGAVNERSMTNAMQQLSTGKRINVAADDAAGLAISTKMTSQIRGLDQAVRNANDGISMLQVVEGATVEMTNMMQRMRELAVQSANDTNTAAERSYLHDEFDQLRSEIDRIATTTQWNGVNVMDGSGAIGTAHTAGTDFGGRDLSYQVGANASQTIDFTVANFRTTADIVASKEQFQFVSGTTTTAIDSAVFTFGSDSATITLPTDIDATSTTFSDWENAASEIQSALRATTALKDVEVTATSNGTLLVTDASGRAISATFGTDGSGAEAGITAPVASTVQTGDTSGDVGVFAAADLTAATITTQSGANSAITSLDTALTNLNAQRSLMGATINRLTYAADNLTNTSANVNAARSRVLDTDYAQATTELARTQIIQQASTAMLAQANQGAQSVLSLLK